MKIYISLDMEGIAGTYTWKQEDSNRQEVRKCITQQVEWIIDGIRSSRVNKQVAEITVSDSHSEGDNLMYSITEADDRLHLISGCPRPRYMMAGLDSTYDVVFFVGYHGGVGSIRSNMDHTYSGRFHRIWINGKPMSESLINAAYAGHFNVPVGLVAGDDSLQEQLKQPDAMPWAEYILTKYSLARFAVKSRPFNVVKKESVEAVRKVLSSAIKKIPVYKFGSPVTLRIELGSASMADAADTMPGIKRLDGVTIEFVHDDYPVVYDAIDAISVLAHSVKW